MPVTTILISESIIRTLRIIPYFQLEPIVASISVVSLSNGQSLRVDLGKGISMSGNSGKLFLNLCLCVLLILSGCQNGVEKVHYLGDADLNYYEKKASEISYPAIHHETAEEVQVTTPPRTIESREHDEIWDLTLQEALHIALKNSKIIKSGGQFLSPGNGLFTNAANTPSVFDPAIQETNVLFGGIGVEAALSAFDTNWAVSTLWGRNDQVQNGIFNGDLGGTSTSETAQFSTSLRKAFAYGGSFQLSHDWNYLGTNSTAALFPSTYTGSLSAQYRQPLLAGAGAEYTRTAGPLQPGFGAITGVSQGVVIARINNDISITNFEASVRDLLRDVENTYWELYLAYRNYDTTTKARNSALQTWRDAKNVRIVGGGKEGFNNWDEPQSRDRYFETKAQTESALSSIYSTETRMRNLLQLPVNDGKVIRPVDEPLTAKFAPDWQTSLTEALTERVELRRQKWDIKSLELQLKAARNVARPQLDFVGGYQVNGFGDSLTGSNDADGVSTSGDLSSAYETMFQGDETGWSIGFEFSVPIGLRRNKTQVRNIELRLCKARKVLDAQEQEIAHELATAFQEVSRTYANAVTNFNRRNAARERTRMLSLIKEAGAQARAGGSVIDQFLRAQESLANAENAYYSSIVAYNQALLDLQYRKGTLLRHNSVHLLEGGWMPKAYEQALQRAWARSHAFDGPKLEAQPREFAQPMPYGGVILRNSDDSPNAESGNGDDPDSTVVDPPMVDPEPDKLPDAASANGLEEARKHSKTSSRIAKQNNAYEGLYGYTQKVEKKSTSAESGRSSQSLNLLPASYNSGHSSIKKSEESRPANTNTGVFSGAASIGSLLD